MADRRITRTRKDRDGDITHVCNPDMSWSPRSSSRTIRDIENRTHTYFVRNHAGRSDVHVATAATGKKYLRTDPNGSCTDNLDDLPDC